MMIDEQLTRGIVGLGLELPPEEQQRLLAFAALLAKWNRVYNLTALREESQMVTHHLLDSLSVLPFLDARSIADIGTGGGLPGIPLAIARPGLQVALVETSHKKASFLQQARTELDLGNTTIVNERVEQWQPEEQFDAVISRAFSDIADFVRLTQHLVDSSGRWYAMKGVNPHDEVAQLPAGFRVDKVMALKVPGLDAARHLIVIERS
ncbi:MAG: 16S rRNA (guanine(527)-N(7))-methyltransferase RsmG [Sterolibacteriaceae bacterium]|nr:16S rRNA (guanine(527)-N(7))-methyltransferase RsmG [Sterolibacteriaceae bacterium]MBK7662692.1 16S rRNA (guanine(527)-N(7))-methyltransferase RsmG [Sterolibacteriaceae bacterium]MBK9086804.1 16S rRNA (guanine(527)-N(7))-methyltransferase RsmG [Sterolibacteriaceae bacterium]